MCPLCATSAALTAAAATTTATAIGTLGFRGEALPSIASVSRLLLETRAAEENTGTCVEIAGGKMLRCEDGNITERSAEYGS